MALTLALIVAALAAAGGAAAGSPFSFEIAPGVHMPGVLLGTGYMPPPCSPSPSCQLAWENATAVANVGAWLAAGGRGIDTANMYNTQPGVAAAIAASGVPRSDIFVLTKVPGVANYSTVTAWLEQDVQQLGGAPLDAVISHWCQASSLGGAGDGDCTPEHITETWRALEDFFLAGKARAIGVSNYCERDLDILLASARVRPHVHQVERHPGYVQDSMVAYCSKHNIHLQGYAPLADADRQAQAGPPAGVLLHNSVVQKVAAARNASAAQVLLQWQLQAGHSVTPRIERQPTRQQYVAENLAVQNGQVTPLSAEEMAALHAIPAMEKCWGAVGVCPA